MLRLGLRTVLTATLIGLGAAQAAATIAFSRSTLSRQLGSDGPQVIHLADVNEDGIDDLIAVDRGADEFIVFLNPGDGSFGGGDVVPTDAGPVAVTTGDFNRDGNVDILTVNQVAGSVSVFVGDGTGTFDTGGRSDTAVGADVRGVVVFDFDDDAIDDAVVISGSRIYSLRSAGDGTLELLNPEGLRTQSSNGTTFDVAAGEIDDDSTPDIVVSNRDDQQVVVFLSNGDGTFTRGAFLNAGQEPTAVELADVDGDSVDDLLVVDASEDLGSFGLEVYVFLGRGDAGGTFEEPETATAGEEAFALATFDADNDNRVDIVVTNANVAQQEPMSVLCQPSDICNLVIPGTPLEAGIWRPGDFLPSLALPNLAQVAVATGRLNGDELDDIASLGSDRQTIGIFLNTSTAGAQTPQPTTPGGVATPTPTGPTATPTPTNTPRPTATPTPIPTLPLGRCEITLRSSVPSEIDPVAMAVADFDRDGRQDVAVADFSGNRVVVFFSAFDSGITTSEDTCPKLDLTVRQTIRGINAPVDLVAADFDRDRRPDLAVIGRDGVTTLFGPGARSAFVQAPTIAAGSDPREVAVEDFNRDGVPDLIVADAGGTSILFFLGVTDREFPFDLESCPYNIRKQSSRVVATDLNRDARADFVVASEQTNDLSVFLRNPNETLDCTSVDRAFSAVAPIGLSGPPRGILARVFDLTDSVPDLAVGVAGTTAAGQVRVLPGQMSGSTGVRYGSGAALADGGDPLSGPRDIVSGDIDRDARADIVVLDTAGGNDVVVYLGQDDGAFGAPLIPESSGPGEAQAIEVVDLDGDGRDDILVANDDGRIVFFLSSDPPATPTPAPTSTPTLVLSPTPTRSFTPTITMTPTRTRRPTETLTPVPTSTARGVITLSGEGCALEARGPSSAAWPLLWAFGALWLRRSLR